MGMCDCASQALLLHPLTLSLKKSSVFLKDLKEIVTVTHCYFNLDYISSKINCMSFPKSMTNLRFLKVSPRLI